ncbi:nuclear factor interleukin-3-regulated protein-like [Erpetoichthys calabaricus]|uniref:Nuclear factor interleukin-3-regulated protein-like n=1 Tax=Erpetoichthys calabaricus TaxID=27687 RepID=A0A8C4STR9_ERPCA|nr:nuclear factor interleukin-3-regulated protein-like [Erpetoichthys calabaricus]
MDVCSLYGGTRPASSSTAPGGTRQMSGAIACSTQPDCPPESPLACGEPYNFFVRSFLGLPVPSAKRTECLPGNSVVRRKREFTPEEQKDSNYWVKRRRNNEAARRSRQRRRMEEMLLETRAVELLRENEKLKAALFAVRYRLGNNEHDNAQEVYRSGMCAFPDRPSAPQELPATDGRHHEVLASDAFAPGHGAFVVGYSDAHFCDTSQSQLSLDIIGAPPHCPSPSETDYVPYRQNQSRENDPAGLPKAIRNEPFTYERLSTDALNVNLDVNFCSDGNLPSRTKELENSNEPENLSGVNDIAYCRSPHKPARNETMSSGIQLNKLPHKLRLKVTAPRSNGDGIGLGLDALSRKQDVEEPASQGSADRPGALDFLEESERQDASQKVESMDALYNRRHVAGREEERKEDQSHNKRGTPGVVHFHSAKRDCPLTKKRDDWGANDHLRDQLASLSAEVERLKQILLMRTTA